MIKNSNLFKTLILGLVISSAAISCKKDKEEEPVPAPTGYTVPTTYNFTNVNYGGQTTRLLMLDEIGTYMTTGNTMNTVLDAQKLKDMYANTNSQFTDAALNTDSKQLKNKTYSLDQPLFDAYFDTLAMHSQSTVAGANGTAGVVTSSSNSSKKYLQGANGIEYAQVIKKGLMGAVFYFQAMDSYLANLAIDDNTNVVAGEGTTMEHHFDEAFGYFGAPIDFPTNTASAKYWSSYSNKVDPALESNAKLMNAFLAARAAISNKDNAKRDTEVAKIKQNWEVLIAAAAIHELNAAKTVLADDAIRNHYVSEAIGFIMSLKYNSQKTITQTQIDQTLAFIGSNIYTISQTNIDDAINSLSTVYGLDAIKGSL